MKEQTDNGRPLTINPKLQITLKFRSSLFKTEFANYICDYNFAV